MNARSWTGVVIGIPLLLVVVPFAALFACSPADLFGDGDLLTVVSGAFAALIVLPALLAAVPCVLLFVAKSTRPRR